MPATPPRDCAARKSALEPRLPPSSSRSSHPPRDSPHDAFERRTFNVVCRTFAPPPPRPSARSRSRTRRLELRTYARRRVRAGGLCDVVAANSFAPSGPAATLRRGRAGARVAAHPRRRVRAGRLRVVVAPNLIRREGGRRVTGSSPREASAAPSRDARPSRRDRRHSPPKVHPRACLRLPLRSRHSHSAGNAAPASDRVRCEAENVRSGQSLAKPLRHRMSIRILARFSIKR